ncbi:hypothetical protein LMG24238_06330 [Paraburkholderia sediminicola]|uniref:Uncharacterized protein n=1 Tax=Paraburkholderia sediminicola TaxID=458836 RepID=A0A6J5CKF8_9BURK|nr:hypothetical protein LMG24238_06330 [Paraburkholderia sediminicola]
MSAANGGHNGRTERDVRASSGAVLLVLSGLFFGLLFGPLVSRQARLYTHANLLGGLAGLPPPCPTECFQ